MSCVLTSILDQVTCQSLLWEGGSVLLIGTCLIIIIIVIGVIEVSCNFVICQLKSYHYRTQVTATMSQRSIIQITPPPP